MTTIHPIKRKSRPIKTPYIIADAIVVPRIENRVLNSEVLNVNSIFFNNLNMNEEYESMKLEYTKYISILNEIIAQKDKELKEQSDLHMDLENKINNLSSRIDQIPPQNAPAKLPAKTPVKKLTEKDLKSIITSNQKKKLDGIVKRWKN